MTIALYTTIIYFRETMKEARCKTFISVPNVSESLEVGSQKSISSIYSFLVLTIEKQKSSAE